MASSFSKQLPSPGRGWGESGRDPKRQQLAGVTLKGTKLRCDSGKAMKLPWVHEELPSLFSRWAENVKEALMRKSNLEEGALGTSVRETKVVFIGKSSATDSFLSASYWSMKIFECNIVNTPNSKARSKVTFHSGNISDSCNDMKSLLWISIIVVLVKYRMASE